MAASERSAYPVDLPAQRAEPGEGLAAIAHLLAGLEREKLAYCHWKSNQHLAAALQGETDLDVLVDRHRSVDLQRVLAEARFKRFASTPWRAYPAMEDYLGFDDETGRLLHVHLHYQLTLGERHLKGYRLPWEELILSTRRLASPGGIYIADPNVEMFLLLVRAGLKLRLRDRALRYLNTDHLPDDLLVEFQWLKEQCQIEQVAGIAQELLGEAASGAIKALVVGGPTMGRLLRLRDSAGDTLRAFRTYGPVRARMLRWVRELYWFAGGLNKRFLHWPVASSRTVPTGGVMVAFVGSDGSGKSTITSDMLRWLSWKMSVYPVYFGSGDGPSSLLRWPLLLARRILVRQRRERPGDATSGGSGRGGPLRRLRLIWALVLAYEKRQKLRRAVRARNRGMIVVCDRYPQDQVVGFNDGPLLTHWSDHRSRVLRALAAWERAPYRWAQQQPPDLIVKLRVSQAVALQRKPDMDPAEIQRRVEAIKSLRFGRKARIVDVDADAPLEQVILEVRRHVWAEL